MGLDVICHTEHGLIVVYMYLAPLVSWLCTTGIHAGLGEQGNAFLACHGAMYSDQNKGTKFGRTAKRVPVT